MVQLMLVVGDASGGVMMGPRERQPKSYPSAPILANSLTGLDPITHIFISPHVVCRPGARARHALQRGGRALLSALRLLRIALHRTARGAQLRWVLFHLCGICVIPMLMPMPNVQRLATARIEYAPPTQLSRACTCLHVEDYAEATKSDTVNEMQLLGLAADSLAHVSLS